MSISLPPALMPGAGLLTIVLIWPHLREQHSNARLVAEAFGMNLVAIALVQAAWALLWWVERHDSVPLRFLP